MHCNVTLPVLPNASSRSPIEVNGFCLSVSWKRLFAFPSTSDSADKVVQGEGKFEEIVVASNEITASTVQLVRSVTMINWQIRTWLSEWQKKLQSWPKLTGQNTNWLRQCSFLFYSSISSRHNLIQALVVICTTLPLPLAMLIATGILRTLRKHSSVATLRGGEEQRKSLRLK